jgi:hypothetical protein
VWKSVKTAGTRREHAGRARVGGSWQLSWAGITSRQIRQGIQGIGVVMGMMAAQTRRGRVSQGGTTTCLHHLGTYLYGMLCSATAGGGVPEALVVAVVGRAGMGGLLGRRPRLAMSSCGIEGGMGNGGGGGKGDCQRARGAAAVLVEGVMAEHRDGDKRLRWCLLVAQGYFWA